MGILESGSPEKDIAATDTDLVPGIPEKGIAATDTDWWVGRSAQPEITANPAQNTIPKGDMVFILVSRSSRFEETRGSLHSECCFDEVAA